MMLRRIGLAVSVVALAGSIPAAQNGQPGQAVEIIQLQHGHPFQGDIRDLPHGLPPQHEKTPKGEEPALGPDHGSGDSATQNAPGDAPTPPPGSGGGAGNFAGLDFQNFGAGWPPDTNGDVGPTYFIQTVNTSVGIFRKSDGTRVAAFSFNTLMSQGNFGNACDNRNGGDPVVVYDPGADRWIISDFAFATSAGNPIAPYFECFAVSRTGDPVSGGWYFYSLQTNDLFPDYPKLGVWPDGIYLTANMFSSSFKNVRVWALNKAQMYAGVPATSLMFNLPARIGNSSVFTAIPSTYHTATGVPPAGRPNLIASIWSAKLARVWKFHVDWNNTANSTVTGPSNVTLASWSVGPSSVPAKNGNGLDSLYERLMVQNQYTNLSGVESLWLTHTVANPSNSALPAPRWYQLNVTGGTVVTSGPLQQSTFAPDTTVGRWMPSLAVDKNGNMAIGYSASSSSLFPAIRYAGRLSTDPVNTLGQSETSLIEGTASQCCNFSDGTVNNRWGDYSAMTIDPDGCTFWYTNEFYQSPQPTTLGADNWQTRIGSFKFASCTPNFATLQGTVTDSVTNAPISGATVTAGASSTNTDVNGQYTLGSLVAGTYNVTVSAAGYNNGAASVTLFAGVTTTQNFALVAGTPQSTSTSVSSSLNPSLYGQTVTFTATVSPAGATGTVQFLDGATSLGVVALGAGTAQLSTSALTAGTHSITAKYSGDANFSTSTSTILTQTVNPQSTTTSVASNLNPSAYGQSVTFTATVSSSSATGTVQFLDGATSLGVVALSAGTAQLSTSALTAGTHSITAKYSGDANFSTSTSTTLTQTVNVQPTTTSVSSGLNPSTYGQSVTFTGTVSSATATGTMQFLDGATSLGVVAVSGGSAQLSTSALTAGSHSITAKYSGDGNFSTSTSAPLTQTVNPHSTTTSVSSSLNPSTYGQGIAFTATVSPSNATGTVQFLDGATSLGVVAVSAGTAQLSTSALTAGSHSITAKYNGDSNFSTSTSTALTQTVNTQSTTTSISSSLNPSTYSQSVTFTATMSSSTATGTVQFLDGASSLGVVALSAGTAQLSTSALTTGSHSITAKYSGDGNFNSSTSTILTQTVNQQSTTTSVSSSLNPSAFGQSVTFTATVSSSSATGTVQFLDGATSLGVVALGAGSAQLSTSALTAGSHSITAKYSGDANFSTSTSSILLQGVNLQSTTTSVSSSLNPSTVGQSVTFTATVSSSNATGTVQFLDGATSLGVVAVSGGSAQLSTAALTQGSHSITAKYSGDGNFATSTSAPLTQTVNGGALTPTTTTLSSSAGSSTFGQSVTFTATVSPSAATGNVQFFDGATSLGTSALSAGTASLSTSTLAVGSHSITATYGGDSTFAGSTSAPVSVTVTAGTRTNVALASNGATATASSTFGGGYAPTGAINGDRLGVNWGSGGGWNDATAGTWPDWVEIDFNGTQTIGEVDVFSVQDNFTSPSTPTDTMTFTQYGLTDFQVQYWTGNGWATVPNGAISGNNLVWRQVTFAPLATTKIRILVTGALNTWSRITEVEAYTPGNAPPANVALASAGATTMASSTVGPGYDGSGAINGDRKGASWGSGGGWNDGTANAWPDWLEVDFAGAKTINEVDVFSVQDNFTAPVDPTPTMTFTQYGLTDFTVQYWDGTQWLAVPGGAISGNNLVWRQVTFAAVTTSKIRILVTSALNTWSRIAEVEAYQSQ